MFRRALFGALFIGALSLQALAAEKGLGVSFANNTRVIYPSNAASVSVQVNNDSNETYLLHSKVIHPDNAETYSREFHFNPAVMELGPNQKRTITLRRIGGVFPSDRESLRYVMGTFIPLENGEAQKTPEVAVGLMIRMKLFVRPKKLQMNDAVEANADKLRFSLQNSSLNITNPTPYFLTFNEIKTNKGEEVLRGDARMLAPFSSVNVELKDPKISKLRWTLVNDGGFYTPPIERAI